MYCEINGVQTECPDFAAFAAFGGVFFLIILAITLIFIIGLWKVFKKAGKPGWAAIIPIYNMVVWLEITKRPLWWIILWFVPFVSIIIFFVMAFDLAKAFGKNAGFGLGIAILSSIFIPILGFGSAKYVGGNINTPSDPAVPPTPPQVPPVTPAPTV